jgi:hypothetical protein
LKTKLIIAATAGILAAMPAAPSAADPANPCPKSFTYGTALDSSKAMARDRDVEGDTCLKPHQNDPSKVNVTEDHQQTL